MSLQKRSSAAYNKARQRDPFFVALCSTTNGRLLAALCAFEVPSHMELEFADNDETESRSREVQLLQNVIEPDPEYQALFISDEANLLDISGLDSKEIEARIRFYFKGDLPAPLNIPVWQFIEMVKQKYPRWPEEWPPKH
jgi:hypothetical protein